MSLMDTRYAHVKVAVQKSESRFEETAITYVPMIATNIESSSAYLHILKAIAHKEI